MLTSGALAATSDQVERIEALEAEIARLKASTGENWLTEQRADEIRSLVSDVLADADTRASLLQSGMTAGYDDGAFIGSTDGNYYMKINLQLQFRFNYNQRSGDTIDEDRWSFENTRTKIAFHGHVFDSTWKYGLRGNFARDGGDNSDVYDGASAISGSGGSFQLENAWIMKELEGGWSVKLGQFKAPLLREELVESYYQLAVERSLANEFFNQDYSQGIQLGYDSDNFRVAAMFHDGIATRNTSSTTADTEFAIAARAELLLAGTWEQFEDFTSWQEEEYGIMIGGAVNWEQDEFGGTFAPEPEQERLTATVDVSVEMGGANLFAAFLYRNVDDDGAAPAGIDLDQWGFVVQGGIFLDPEIELFARYEYADSDGVTAEDLSIATIGVNKYFAKHNLKWTTDFGYAFDELESAWFSGGSSSITGFQPDEADEDGQWLIRSQFQLLF